MARKPVPTEVRQVYQRVEKLLDARGLTTKWLYDRVGMSKEGWSNMLQSGSMKLGTLYKVAQALKVEPVTLLIGDTPELATVSAEPPARYGTGRYLEDRVADLEQELQNLKAKLKLQ